MRYSLLLPIGHADPEQVAVFGRLVQRTSAHRLWLAQSQVYDHHHLAAWMAGAGVRVPVGFGVSLMPHRTPYQAALEARSIARATGEPVVAGYGPGAVATQEALMGRPYRSQLGASREYARIVRKLLAGETTDAEGEDFPLTAGLFDVPEPPVVPRPEVGLGVLRERMAKVAGEVADRAITWMSPAEHLGNSLIPAIRGASRDLPDPAGVTAIVPVALARQGRDPRRLAAAACGRHVQQPHYQAALQGAGIRVGGRGDPADADRLLDSGVFLYGDTDRIRAGLNRFASAGVDEVVLNMTGVGLLHGLRQAAADLCEVFAVIPPEESHPLPPVTAPGGRAPTHTTEKEGITL